MKDVTDLYANEDKVKRLRKFKSVILFWNTFCLYSFGLNEGLKN